MQKLRPDQIAELVAAYQDGDTTYVLARRYGTKRETISRHLEEAGIARRGGAKPHDGQAEQADAPAKIREWARANGYQVRDRGRLPAEVVRAWERSIRSPTGDRAVS